MLGWVQLKVYKKMCSLYDSYTLTFAVLGTDLVTPSHNPMPCRVKALVCGRINSESCKDDHFSFPFK